MGGFRGGGGGGGLADAFSSGIRPPADPRVPLFTITRYPFLVTVPKIFLKAPLAPIYTNFETEARAEKTRFFG